MSYSACDFMDDVCSATSEAGLMATDLPDGDELQNVYSLAVMCALGKAGELLTAEQKRQVRDYAKEQVAILVAEMEAS